MSEQDLDTRIRSLVARAVADAPAAPEVDPTTALEGRSSARDRHLHRGWWAGGGAALLAAAAAITTVVLVADTDDRISTPSDTTAPTVEPTVAPTTPAPVTAPSTVPGPAAPTVPAVVPPPPSTSPPPSTAPPGAILIGEQVATAGPDGVVLRDRTGAELRRLDQPAQRALPVGDGRVVVELAATGTEGGDVVIWQSDGTTSAPIPPIEAPGGRFEIEDVAVVGGRPVLLFQWWTGAQEELRSVLFTAPLTADGLDESQAVSFGEVGGYEWGLSRLELANSGLIVGTSSNESSYGMYVDAMPGTRAVDQLGALTPAALGLEDSYSFVEGCDGCPASFTTDGDGARLAWTQGTDLVIHLIGSGERAAVPAGDLVDPFVDIDLSAEGGTFSYGEFGDRPPVRLVDEERITLEGYRADVGPTIPSGPGLGTGAGTDDPGDTTDPTAPAGFVIAGPGGVAVLDGPAELRRLEQPAEVAHATPGGAVIFQPARTTPDGDPGDPLVWRPDGTVERLLGVLGERQSYRLYDVEAVAGVPTVLYGLFTRGAGEGAATDVAGYNEVLHALTMTPGAWTDVVLHEMPTWESGYSDLTLSQDGLVVGETSHSVSHSLFSVAVPGSPAAATGPLTPAALGLRDVYGDEVSPRLLAVSPGGDVVAWVEGTDVVVHTVATGDERRWSVPALADLAVRALEVRPADAGAVRLVVRTGWPGTADGQASFELTLTDAGDTSMVRIGGTEFASFAP